MDNPIFSILIVTYNRHKMLKECIQSLLESTFKNFECFILDRGSEPSTEPIINSLKDKRFNYIQSSQSIHLVDSGNEIIKRINGKYFYNIADDDICMKNTLDLVNLAFEKNSDCDIIQTGLCTFDISLKEHHPIDIKSISSWGNKKFDDSNCYFAKFDGKNMACDVWMSSGIGKYKKYNTYAYPHPTGLFIRKTAIDYVFKKQGGLFVKTFQDGGYHSIAYKTKIIYINVPLGIFSIHHQTRESDINRRRWQSEFKNLEFTPLKDVSTFWNCSIDTSLKVIYRNNIDTEYKTFLRPDFFIRELLVVLQDSPKDLITLKDSIKIFINLIKSIILHPLAWPLGKDFFNFIIKPIIFFFPIKKYLKILINKIKHNTEYSTFDNILQFKNYLEQKFEERYITMKKILKNE